QIRNSAVKNTNRKTRTSCRLCSSSCSSWLRGELRGELLIRFNFSSLFVAGGGYADRSLLHRCARDLVIDHHTLVIAIEAEVDPLLAVLLAHTQPVFGEGAGAGQCGGDQQGGENLVHG